MNYIIKLVVEYKACKSDLIFEDLVHQLGHTINYYKNAVPKYYQDDFEQELLEKLLNVINRFNIKAIKSISINLFTKDNLKLLERFEFKNVNEVLKHKYIFDFINKYGKDLLISAFNKEEKNVVFQSEYELYCNENQFIKYLNKSYESNVKLFYRNLKKDEMKYCTLNTYTLDGIELIDLVPNENNDNNEIKIFYDETLLSKEDKKFLDLFNNNGKIITEREVAKKLNITQQAVSSRLKRIRKRYKKRFNQVYKKI